MHLLLSFKTDDNADDDKPVWPTWAVGALFRGARCIICSKLGRPTSAVGELHTGGCTQSRRLPLSLSLS